MKKFALENDFTLGRTAHLLQGFARQTMAHGFDKAREVPPIAFQDLQNLSCECGA
jgi:hypothetical protein